MSSSCKGNVVTINERIGKCASCNSSVRLTRCNMMFRADLLVIGNDNNNYSLQAFAAIIEAILDVNNINDQSLDSITESLLMAPPFNEKIFTSISR